MNYPNTYQIMLDIVSNLTIDDMLSFNLSDFNNEQRSQILSSFQDECDSDLQHAMMHDTPFSRRLSVALLNLSHLSKENLYLAQKDINNICWSNIQSFLDDILDDVICEHYKFMGGLSEYEENFRLDRIERSKDMMEASNQKFYGEVA